MRLLADGTVPSSLPRRVLLPFVATSRSRQHPRLAADQPRRRRRSRSGYSMMWGIAAAVASAAAVAVASGAELLACDCAPPVPAAAAAVGRCDGFLFRQQQQQQGSSSSMGNAVAEEKFAPRFDGLRFIETLVTAHR